MFYLLSMPTREITYDFLTALKCAHAVNECLRPVSWKGYGYALELNSNHQLVLVPGGNYADLIAMDTFLEQWEVLPRITVLRERRYSK